MKIYIVLIIIGLYFFSFGIGAQNIQPIDIDSTRNADDFLTFSDSLRNDSALFLEEGFVHLAVDTMSFKPNSTKAVIFSALVPGLGQIYNRKYWKLPLVYGSFIGCLYAITWNNSQYSGYKKAYIEFEETIEKKDLGTVPEKLVSYTDNGKVLDFYNQKLIASEKAGTSWQNYIPASFPENLDEWTADQKNQFRSRLKSSKDYYRYYRDMSVIITVGVYAIWMIDAYVDAQLFDFDVSPDLSMRAMPVIFDKTSVNSRSFGLQLCFTF